MRAGRRLRATAISPCGLPCASLATGTAICRAPSVTRALQATAVSNARTGAAPTAPRGGRVGRLAQVQVPGFAGGTPVEQVEFAEELKNIIQLHDVGDVCGWVVDLRQNSGGNLWPMLAGLGPLLGGGELAASVYPDGRRVGVWYRDGQAGFGDYTQLRVRTPYRLRAPLPVAVLVGPGTASSAEVLAVALRGQPRHAVVRRAHAGLECRQPHVSARRWRVVGADGGGDERCRGRGARGAVRTGRTRHGRQHGCPVRDRCCPRRGSRLAPGR